MALPDPPPDDPNPDEIRRLFDQYRADDKAALCRLIERTYPRCYAIARRMLAEYPRVRSEVDTGDVLHRGIEKLLKALGTFVPESLTHFYRFAAQHFRWDLLDLARKVQARDMATDPDAVLGQEPDRGGEPSHLAQWTEFQEGIDRLPEDLRAVVDLRFYQLLKLEEVARGLGISVRTAKRRWRQAVELLSVGSVAE
jgi:RNA polymerase sigma factor (sigma-70 family)